MDEFEVLLRLAIIVDLYRHRPDMIRSRVKRLMDYAHPSIRPGLAIIVLSKNPGAVIQRAVDKW